MKIFTIKDVLFYYDGPQVLEARDSIGGHYILLAIDQPVGQFCAVGVSPESLRQFKRGEVDLLSLFENRTRDRSWHIVDQSMVNPDLFEEISAHVGEVYADYLPEEGFYLEPKKSGSALVDLAHETKQLAIELILDPPDATDHRIRLESIGQVLIGIQRVVDYSFKAILRDGPDDSGKSSSSSLQLAGISSGSVKLAIYSEEVSMFGGSHLSPAMKLVESLLRSASDPTLVVKLLRSYPGHLSTTFVKFLETLVELETPIQLTWASALSDEVNMVALSTREARAALEGIRKVVYEAGEIRIVKGILKKIDLDSGAWRIGSGRNAVHGKTADGGPSLSSLVAGEYYVFTCNEHLEISSSGRDRKTLFLEKIDR